MTEPARIKEQISDSNDNIHKIKCQFCNSLILLPKHAKFEAKEFPLPLMHQKKDDSRNLEELETQSFIEYWIIHDMFTFENIGFSNSVGDYKYLICADCEMGPIGYHVIATKKSYIALQRVKHEA